MARNPNPHRKWAAHSEWCYERQGLPMDVLKRILKVHWQTIYRWDMGHRPVPHWVPRMLRLHRMEATLVLAQMTGQEAVPLRGLLYMEPPAASVGSVGALVLAA